MSPQPAFGRYVDLALLGQGGMGAVYRGRDPDLDRAVAIKVVLDASADFIERFRREARAVAKLSHPNVVQVFDFGQDADGHPYFVMELVEGRSLDQVLRGGALPPVEVASVLAQAAAGLAAAHEAGIVHRDIKPSNLIVDERGRVKVVDFGIARSEDTPLMTRPSAMIGTPTYMSPEQVQGHPVDGRSDLYSLGVACFHLLAGNPPFDATEPIALALAHIQQELPSVIERAPGTPPPLAALIVRMCAKDPARRPQSAAEVRDAAEAILADLGGRPALLSGARMSPLVGAAGASPSSAGTGVVIPPTRMGERPAKKPPVAVIGSIAALVAGGAAFAVVLALKKPPPPTEPPKIEAPKPPPTPAPPTGPIVEKAVVRAPMTGPVRVAVLKFKNLGKDEELVFLEDGIGETVVTELHGAAKEAVRLVERGMVDAEIGEIDFGQTKYVDRSTAAALGKIEGAEVAVQGGFQRAGKTVRVTARFVAVATGEILDTVVITRPAERSDKLLLIQDAVAAELKSHLLAVAKKVRP